ncbi:DUF302 domain-containing protein [Geminicoccaceae bacterium 1502E]|nr:DUF302 domain-containing protein [Geminicoccaceae bacterium 1502E]
MRRKAMAGVLTLGAVLAAGAAGAAGMPEEREGWVIMPTGHGFEDLVGRVESAVEESPLAVVTRASATKGAASIGQTILGNMVVGVFAPTFALRLLEASLPAGIEAPLRLYLTENADGTTTLSWERPTTIFAAYPEGGEKLEELAGELEDILRQIGEQAAGS